MAIKLSSLLSGGASVALLIGISGCIVSDSDARNFVEENVRSCGGTVSGVTLTRTGLLSNEYTGFAQVTIGGESYTPEMKATSDGFNTVLSLQQDPCKVHQLKLEASRLQVEAQQMQREAMQSLNELQNSF